MQPKFTLICVDDEPLVTQNIKLQLENYFAETCTIETAQSAQEALELIHELLANHVEIPVLIADHIMPGIQGDELLIRVQKIAPQIFKIMLTGQANPVAIGRAINEANLYRYISKPWNEDELIFSIREALHKYQSNKSLAEKDEKIRQYTEELEKKVSERTLQLQQNIQKLHLIQEELLKAQEMSNYKGALLEAVVKSNQKLIHEHNWEDSLSLSLALIGKALHMDRAYYAQTEKDPIIWENQPSPLPYSATYNDILENLPKNQIHELTTSRLMAGKLRNWLEIQDIKSLFLFPVLVESQFVGFIRFEDCQKERYITLDEKNILQSFTNSLSGAMLLQRKQAELMRQNDHIEALNDNLEDLIQQRTEKLEQRNKQLEEYGFHNAHTLRRPVATILGLFEVIKITETVPEKETIFKHLHTVVRELDEVVHKMQAIINE